MTQPQLWISALEMGCFFGLLALAYYLVLVGAGFFNFAIGPYAMMGGLCTSWLVIQQGLGAWAAAGIALVASMALAAVTELAVVRPVQRRSGGGELPALVAVAAVLFAIQQLAGYLFGHTTLPGQSLVTFDPLPLGDTFVQPNTVLLVAVTAVGFTAFALWIRLTRTGRLLRAVGDSKHAAALLGLPVNRIRLIAFLLSGLLAALTGLLFAPKAGVSSLSGLSWALSGFLAMVVGGTGSVWAPLLGGLLLGAIEVFLPYYFGGQAGVYGLLVVALLFFAFKPNGLFVRRVRT
jgi:branched-chain amino acid transport system permease protein